MVRLLVIKRQQFFKYCCIIFILFMSIYITYIFIKKDITVLSFNKNFFQNEIKEDFNGDGIVDSIALEKKHSNYIINIKCSNNTYTLKSTNSNEEFLELSPSHNIKINSIDLSRDNIPEIIITGVKNNVPSTYIFKWVKDDFQEIFSTNKNIIGIIDSNNSRTPIILHTSSSKGDSETEAYMFTADSLKNISYSTPRIVSLSVIQKFIDLIELPYELADAPDLFSPSIASEELGLLWNLDKSTFNYSFQNGYFRDICWDDNGKTTSLIWTLSFNKFNTTNSKNTELILYVTAEINQLGEFKISSITK